jgi:hypothetical protein
MSLTVNIAKYRKYHDTLSAPTSDTWIGFFHWIQGDIYESIMEGKKRYPTCEAGDDFLGGFSMVRSVGHQHDLHGNAPDGSDVALLLIGVINDLEFPEGEQLLPS